jgi:hypothetical protein
MVLYHRMLHKVWKWSTPSQIRNLQNHAGIFSQKLEVNATEIKQFYCLDDLNFLENNFMDLLGVYLS